MMLALAWPCKVLVGSDRNTGPQGGVLLNLRARRTVSGMVAVHCAFQNHLVMGWVISSTCSVSWVNSRPSSSWPTEATATMSGMLSFQLLTIWVMALGRPILATTMTAGLPVARAYPSAMATTAPSWTPLMS